ncbi:Hypothetical protein SSCIU_01368 [Mammaliicoccus sciuri]|nr:Hypothetical protein SSCIU_01368 [Mammaliicoccus sciuri]
MKTDIQIEQYLRYML